METASLDRSSAEGSDFEDRHVGVSAGEAAQISRIVGGDHASAEPDRGGDGKRIDGQLATRVGVGKEVPGDPGDPGPSRDDLSEPASEEGVDRFVGAVPSVFENTQFSMSRFCALMTLMPWRW